MGNQNPPRRRRDTEKSKSKNFSPQMNVDNADGEKPKTLPLMNSDEIGTSGHRRIETSKNRKLLPRINADERGSSLIKMKEFSLSARWSEIDKIAIPVLR
jgi:hypothetical protein